MPAKIWIFLIIASCVPAIAQDSQLTLKQRALRDGNATQLVVGSSCCISPWCDFDHIVKESSVVAIGKVTQKDTRLAPDENGTWTDYSFLARSVLKGDVHAGTSLEVISPGGAVEIGTAVAETTVQSFPLLISRESYVLFLSRTNSAEPYVLTQAGLGAYRITPDEHVICHQQHSTNAALCGIPLSDFIAKIEAALNSAASGE
jgi:hypothetical protein